MSDVNPHEKWRRRGREHWRNGPPWAHNGPSWGQGEGWGGQPAARHGRFLFLRFVAIFGFIILLLVGFFATVGFLISQAWHFGGPPIARFVWLGGCGLIFALPLMAIFVSIRAFRRIPSPLGEVM